MGTGPWTVDWSDGFTQTTNASPATRVVTPTGTTTYTVTNLVDVNCTAQPGDLTGSAIVTVNPVPGDFVVTGGGAYCAGGAGVAVELSGSESGVNYQLKLNG